MSGGYFDYQQYKINDIADTIESYIYGHELSEEEINDIEIDYKHGYIDEDEYKYRKEHHHTMPNRYGYNDYTIASFKDGLKFLKLAAIYAQRIDWLMSGDDGEESFHERLKEDVERLKENLIEQFNKDFKYVRN